MCARVYYCFRGTHLLKTSPFTLSPRCLHSEMRMDYPTRCVFEKRQTGLDAMYLISKIINRDCVIQMMFL